MDGQRQTEGQDADSGFRLKVTNIRVIKIFILHMKKPPQESSFECFGTENLSKPRVCGGLRHNKQSVLMQNFSKQKFLKRKTRKVKGEVEETDTANTQNTKEH